MSVEKYDWAVQKNLFALTNQDSTFSHTRENSKMFNITSKCFSFFNNKPPARDFLTCYSCSYYSSMHQSTTIDVIYLSSLHGCIGIKQFSTTCSCTRVSFIVKMLNHNKETFKNIGY